MWDAWVHSNDGLGSSDGAGDTEFPEVAGEVLEYISMSRCILGERISCYRQEDIAENRATS